MNVAYLQRFVNVMTPTTSTTAENEVNTLRDSQPPEDQALGVVMAYQNIWPRNTQDALGRDRFHMETPSIMYDPPLMDLELFRTAHKAAGAPWKVGVECCNPYSISFHHLTPEAMLDWHHQVYNSKKCRRRRRSAGG
jgi:hypothetical protein